MTNESVDNCPAPHADISSLDERARRRRRESRRRGRRLGLRRVHGSRRAREAEGSAARSACRRRTAPGIDGHTADDYYSGFGGTSAAAPLVAGIAGLLLSLNPELTRSDLAADPRAHGRQDRPRRRGLRRRGLQHARGLRPRERGARARADRDDRGRARARRRRASRSASRSPRARRSACDRLVVAARATGDRRPRRAARADARRRALSVGHWSGLAIDAPGTFTLAADARDLRYAEPPSGYPHRAARAGGRARRYG